MLHPWKNLAIGCGLALLVPLGARSAAEQPVFSDTAALSVDAFTEAVLSVNAGLDAMRAAVAEATARIEPAGSLDDPMLSISVAPNTFGSEMVDGGRGQIQVSQALPWWGTLDAREAAARAEAEAARQDVEALRLRLQSMARGAFADWAFVHRSLAINASNQAVLADLRSIARVRYATGQAPQQDVLQADVERALLRQQALELERQRTSVQARMNALLNRPPSAAMPAPADLPNPVDLPPQELVAERASAVHPQLERLEFQQRAAEAQAQLAQKARYPEFRLNAGYNSLWENNDLRTTVGVSINIPLDQGKRNAAIDGARARIRRTARMLDDQRAGVLAELATAYAAVREAAESLALYREELVPLALNTLEVAKADYTGGRGDFLNVLTAERNRLNTELKQAQIHAAYLRRLAELERAAGGPLDVVSSTATSTR